MPPRTRGAAAARLAGLGRAETLERGGDCAIDLRADGHSDVARAHLDQLGRGLDARAPADDSVAARVDRDEADAGREVALELVPEARATVAPQARAPEDPRRAGGAEDAHRVDLRTHERVDVERVRQ